VEDKKYHNVSETGSVSVLRWMGQDKPTQLGPLERASLNHTIVRILSSLSITFLKYSLWRLLLYQDTIVDEIEICPAALLSRGNFSAIMDTCNTQSACFPLPMSSVCVHHCMLTYRQNTQQDRRAYLTLFFLLWRIESKKKPVTRLRHRKHHVSVATARNDRQIVGERCSVTGPCRGYIWKTETDKESRSCLGENKNLGHGSRRDCSQEWLCWRRPTAI
jgi:hypothetical protein